MAIPQLGTTPQAMILPFALLQLKPWENGMGPSQW
jgi:hypothetical protein